MKKEKPADYADAGVCNNAHENVRRRMPHLDPNPRKKTMWMRKIAVCVAAMGLSAAALAAPPKEAAIDELIQVARLREQTETMMQSMEKDLATNMNGMMAGIAGREISPAKRQRLQGMQRQMMQILREEMAWEKIQPIYRQIYKESFTQEEIDGMLAFYRSPVGQAMLQKMPQVMERSMQISRERLLPRVTQRMTQLLSETVQGESGKAATPAAQGKAPAAAQ